MVTLGALCFLSAVTCRRAPARVIAAPGPLPELPAPPPQAPLIVNRVGLRDTVMGLVWDVEAGTPLSGATIAEIGTRVYAVADTFGRFRLGGMAPGRHFLVTRRWGYEVRRDTVELLGGGGGLSVGLRLRRLPSTLVELCLCLPGSGLLLELASKDSARTIDNAIVTVRGPGRNVKVDTLHAIDFPVRSANREYMLGREGPVAVEIEAPGFKRWSARDLRLPYHLVVSLEPE
jgi:hypothetical protein